MDRCLYVAFLNQTSDIDRRVIKAAQRDLVPGPGKFPRLKLAMGLATALLLCSIIAEGLLHATIRQPGGGHFPAVVKAMTGQSGKAAEYTPQKTRSDLPLPGKKPAAEAPALSTRPIARFLAAHGLSHLMDSFVAAVKSGDFQKLTDTIFIQTGYELVRLNRIPPQVRNRYGVLRYPVAADKSPTHFLLWKPRLRIQHFSKFYKGEEILKLQQILADFGLYTFRKDGIVGRHLIEALTRFQARLNLPATGRPDPGTVFMICSIDGSRLQ